MKSILYYLSLALPESRRRAWVMRLSARYCKGQFLSYPRYLDHARSMLMVLPENTVEALCQVDNVAALIDRFPQASLTVFCNTEVAEYYHSVVADASFVEYDMSQRYLFSPYLARHRSALMRERFNLCFLLDLSPHLAILDIVGRSGATVRAGYAEAADFPILNHIVRMSGISMSRAERYRALARSLGASVTLEPRLEVSKEASDGVARLMRDLQIAATTPLVTVDACGMVSLLGRQWTGELFQCLRNVLPHTLCCPAAHGTTEDLLQWIAAQGCIVIPPLSVPRLAALLTRSTVVIAPNSPLLQLAVLLKRHGAALLAAADRHYLPSSSTIQPVLYERKPDQQTAQKIVSTTLSLMSECGLSSGQCSGA